MSVHLTAAQVAPRLQCNDATVRRLARAGTLRGSFVAGRWLFDEEDLQDFLDGAANRPPSRRRRRRAA